MQNFDRMGSNNSQLTNVENWVSSKNEVCIEKPDWSTYGSFPYHA